MFYLQIYLLIGVAFILFIRNNISYTVNISFLNDFWKDVYANVIIVAIWPLWFLVWFLNFIADLLDPDDDDSDDEDEGGIFSFSFV
jgi:hypothetical protein